jgi:hypothetical protein
LEHNQPFTLILENNLIVGMKVLGVHRSDKPEKKFYAELESDSGRTKRVYFGAAGMTDYTKSKDPERKERYLNRHRKNENWSDPNTAGFWARWVLWNYPSLTKSIEDAKRRV